jgi:hypothetical protein
VNFITKFYRLIVVCLLTTIAIPVLIQFFFWFWERYFPELDGGAATLFNNLVTPIATIASVFLFVRLSIRQQELAESQSVTPHYERELDRIQKKMNFKEKTTYASDAEVINYVPGEVYTVSQDPVFKKDWADYDDGKIQSAKYYVSQPYFNLQKHLNQTQIFPLESLDQAIQLLEEIDSKQCKLNPESKRFLKGRLRTEILGTYIQGIQFVGRRDSAYRVYVTEGGNSRFLTIDETHYGSYYEKLQKYFDI